MMPTEKVDVVYPSGIRLGLLMTSVFIGMFLVALDKLIISTAIPAITDEFHSANDIGWYGTAYLLTNCAFLLVFGKMYTFLDVKATFMAAAVLFEVGSAICGAAPNSITFIIGRAIAGLGAGGIQSGVWSNGKIIALLVVSFTLLIAFILIQIWKPAQATVPPHIFTQRSIAGGFWVSCCVGAHQTLLIYFLPIWFQAIKGDSAVESGIHLLPMVLSLVVASILTGVLTTRVGYYMPFLILGICIAAIGAGVLTCLHVDVSVGQWIGYQVLYGFGLGACFQAPNMAAQTVLPRDEVSIGASLMLFAQTLFGAIFVSVGQNVLNSELAKRLAKFSNITPEQIESAGVTGLFKMIPDKYQGAALQAYNSSLSVCFRVVLIMACLAILGGLVMEWRSVKKELGEEIGDDVEMRSVEA
ncbi:hypothetical protein Neosp_001182 [[Neocosmospora] mangrovei]